MLNSKNTLIKIVGVFAYGFLLLFVLAFIGAMFGSEDTPTSTMAAQAEDDDNLTVSDVEWMIGKQESISVSDDGYVVIMRPYDTYLWSRTIYLSDTTDMFEKLFKDPRITKAKISTYMKGKDMYGKDALQRGTSFTMTKETASQIEWRNFLYENLPGVADEAYINPQLED